MNRILVVLFLLLLWAISAALSGVAFGAQPAPEFTGGYELPTTTVPPPRAVIYDYADVAVLVAVLLVASWLALKKRSRRGIHLLSIFSLLYFGLWRGGCVCAVGSVQNCALTIAHSGYAMPLAVAGFFFLPLIFALFFGRAFCAAACPLGAIQDLVLVRPVKVPDWLAHSLGLLRYVYLGAAVLLAAMGSAFIICSYDPFVAFFRFSGSTKMVLFGAAVLVISIFVGRPYCRFLCPYSVLLKWLSKVSKWHTTITPDECVQCRLCEDACPFGAIKKPTAGSAVGRTEGKKRLVALLLLLPLLVVLGGFVGHLTSRRLARTNATVRTADLVWQDEKEALDPVPDEVTAFRKTGEPSRELFDQAADLRRKYDTVGWILGAWVGLVVGGKLIALSIRRKRSDYEPDRGECFSCGRCFSYCPREHLRLKSAAEQASAAGRGSTAAPA